MLYLAIETSTSRGSVALGNSSVVLHRETLSDERGRHSRSLFPALENMGLSRPKLDGIFVGLGPGSFSGIRVGIAAAHAIAAVQKISVIGICSAFSVALQKPKVSRLGVFADARRGEAYVTVFHCGALERSTYLIPNAQLEDEMSKMTLAVSAEPLGPVQERAYPQASDFFSIPESSPHWVRQNLEPIYLRDTFQAPCKPAA